MVTFDPFHGDFDWNQILMFHQFAEETTQFGVTTEYRATHFHIIE